MLLFRSVLPLVVKLDAATFEVNVTDRSQDMKNQFQQQLKVPLYHINKLYCTIYNTHMKQKCFKFFLMEFITHIYFQISINMIKQFGFIDKYTLNVIK